MGFLSLKDFVLAPPVPAIVTLLIVAGVVGVSQAAIRRYKHSPGICEQGAAFFLTFSVLGALVHGLVLAHAATLLGLRILAAVMAIAGGVTLFRVHLRFATLLQTLRRAWSAAAGIERAASLAVAVTVGALFLAAAGPVTDPDSLDYHLGIPVQWLREGGIAAQPNWMHARLTGVGEGINVLGLAAGTDGLGAGVQFSGLVVLLAAMWSLGRSPRDRILGLLLALPPLVLPLTISQKPQLFPAAAVVIALMLAPSARSRVDFALVFGCVAGAMAMKYLFFVSGGVVMAATLVWAYRHRVLRIAAPCAAAALAVLVLPVLTRNFYLYGDPVSPFLEGFRSHPDADVVRFAVYLRNAGGRPQTVVEICKVLVKAVLPVSLGGAQIVLGIGILAAVLISLSEISFVAVLGSAIVVLFTLWKGQVAPRHLLEPYLWCAAAALLSPWSRLKSVLYHALVLQTVGVAILALVAGFLLFPGALTRGLRDRTMRHYTFGYEEALWLDRVLPADAVIVSYSRAYALFPRPFRIPCSSCDLTSPPGRPDPREVLDELVPVDLPPSGCRLLTVAGPEQFAYAVRNPFNRATYSVIATRMVCD